MTEIKTGATPGQLMYEQFCRDEWARPERRCWNRWETLMPEEKAKWEQDAMLWNLR